MPRNRDGKTRSAGACKVLEVDAEEGIPLYVSALIIHAIKDGLDLLDICLELCIPVPALEVP